MNRRRRVPSITCRPRWPRALSPSSSLKQAKPLLLLYLQPFFFGKKIGVFRTERMFVHPRSDMYMRRTTNAPFVPPSPPPPWLRSSGSPAVARALSTAKIDCKEKVVCGSDGRRARALACSRSCDQPEDDQERCRLPVRCQCHHSCLTCWRCCRCCEPHRPRPRLLPEGPLPSPLQFRTGHTAEESSLWLFLLPGCWRLYVVETFSHSGLSSSSLVQTTHALWAVRLSQGRSRGSEYPVAFLRDGCNVGYNKQMGVWLEG